MDTSLNKAQHKQELLCGKYLALVGICMSLRNLTKFIQLRSISKLRFNKTNTNSDITPPNNIDLVTFEKKISHEMLCLPRHNYINQFSLSK
jgi:glutaredoxin-related protein